MNVLGRGGMGACQDIVSQEVMVGVTLIPHLVPGEGHLQTVFNGRNIRTPPRAAGMN